MKNKRIFLLFVMIQLMVCLSFTAYAADADVAYTLESSTSMVDPGETVTIGISISKNNGFLNAIADLQYDSDAVVYEGYSLSDSIYDEGQIIVNHPTVGLIKITIGDGIGALISPDPEIYDSTGNVITMTFRVLDDYNGKVAFSLDAKPANVLTPAKNFTYTVAGASTSFTVGDEVIHEHMPEQIPGVAPTCSQTGLTAGEKCSDCGEILLAQEEIALMEHTFGEWVITTPATETAEGEETRSCTACDASEARTINKLPNTATDDEIQPDDPPENGSAPIALIVGIAVGVIAVAIVAVVILKKTKAS